jgi:hypothetical protein
MISWARTSLLQTGQYFWCLILLLHVSCI